MIVCFDCFKLFQTISNKNKTCNGPGSQSESENRTWHHALTSRRKNVFRSILHTFWKDNNNDFNQHCSFNSFSDWLIELLSKAYLSHNYWSTHHNETFGKYGSLQHVITVVIHLWHCDLFRSLWGILLTITTWQV